VPREQVRPWLASTYPEGVSSARQDSTGVRLRLRLPPLEGTVNDRVVVVEADRQEGGLAKVTVTVDDGQ